MKCHHVIRDTNCNEKEINVAKNEMQSNAKHKFKGFKEQGVGRMVNQDWLDKMINNEGDEYGIG